jgi:glutathione S-transferase
MLELHHDWDAFCCIKVRFCLAEKGVAWASRVVDLQQMEQLRPEFLALNPNGVVPVLVHEGRTLTESSFINEYIDEVFPGPPLVPCDPLERHAMRVWVKFEDDVLHPAVKGPTYQLMLRQAFARMPPGLVEERIRQAPTPQKAALLREAAEGGTPDLAAVEAARQTLARAIDRLEARLAGNPWFAGPTFSLADIAVAPLVDRLQHLNFAGLWSGKPALQDWIRRIEARPGYKAAQPRPEQRIPTPLPLQGQVIGFSDEGI